jgi:hypothetical protein
LGEAAVIVINLPSFDPKCEPQDQHNHFMTASRARQLLAVVERVDQDASGSLNSIFVPTPR